MYITHLVSRFLCGGGSTVKVSGVQPKMPVVEVSNNTAFELLFSQSIEFILMIAIIAKTSQ